MDDLPHYVAIPQFNRMRKEYLYDDIWQQPELSQRDKSLVTCAILGALGKNEELAAHMQKAITNGVTPDELRGLVVQVAVYAGWPCGVNSAKAGQPIFEADMADKG